jgi:hypothetical protein
MRVLAGLVVADEDLDASGKILDGGEAGLAHDALQHDAPGDLDFDRCGFEFFARFFTVKLIDLAGGIFATEVIGESFTCSAPFSELGTAFGDDVIFVLGWGGNRVDHGKSSNKSENL